MMFSKKDIIKLIVAGTLFFAIVALILWREIGKDIARAQSREAIKVDCWKNQTEQMEKTKDKVIFFKSCYDETRITRKMSFKDFSKAEKEANEGVVKKIIKRIKRLFRLTPYKKVVSYLPKQFFLPPPPNCTAPAPIRFIATPLQKIIINHGWRRSGCKNERFITMLEGESKINPYAIEILDDGKPGKGRGSCQVDFRFWPEIHTDPGYRKDVRFQIDVCWVLYKKGVKFYGGSDKVNRRVMKLYVFPKHKNDA